jgi:mannose-6-phosphate isomerase-like protein (cupin superfamily)
MKPEFVKKSWGWELWFANVQEKNEIVEYEDLLKPKTTDYCGKLLFVEHDQWSSKGRYHYHKIKDETFFVLEGELRLVYVDETNTPHHLTLFPNDTFRLKPGVKHKFTSTSYTGCKFIEVSTFHSDDDSYRCTYDVESGEWLE